MELEMDVEDLLSKRKLESDRIEFKTGWNPDDIYHSVCAFANDYNNDGGGYIVVGVEEENGVAKRPVKGLPEYMLDSIQKDMLGYNNLISPPYFPQGIPAEVDGKWIFVIVVRTGQQRPYKSPEHVDGGVKDIQLSISGNRRGCGKRIYHRDYMSFEPVTIEIEPDCINIMNFPGIDRSISEKTIAEGKRFVSRYYRNRRLGEFLKELDLSEGHSSGIPTIQEELEKNGSPRAEFFTDEDRRATRIRIPIHPAFLKTDDEVSLPDSYEKATKKSSKKKIEQYNKILKLLNDGEWHKTAEIADNLGLKDTRTKELLKELIALDKLIDNGKTKGKLYRLK